MPLLAISSTTPGATGLGPPITTGWTKVGTSAYGAFAHGTATVTVTTLDVGDIVVLALGGGNGSAPAAPTQIGSPNTTGWQSAGGPVFDSNFGGGVNIWFGYVVNPTVNDVITVAWNAAGTGHTTFIAAYQFSTGVNNMVVVPDVSGSLNNVSGTTFPFPPLTPGGTGELYFGASCSVSDGAAGTTAGFVYDVADSQFLNCWDLNVAAAVAPTGKLSPASTSGSLGVLLGPFQASATTNSNSVTLGVVPTGRMWVVSQIGYEILPVTPATDIVATVTMNNRAVYTGANGNGGSNQGPPYITVRPGDALVVSWTNVPIGSSCVGNFFYNEYDAYAQPQDIGGLV